MSTLRKLSFGPQGGGAGLSFEQYVRSALTQIERWSYAVSNVLSDVVRTELTIASGIITVNRNYHSVDTESNAASDDLDTINGGSDGMTLIIRADNSARTVVVKDGTGNIQGPGDVTLDNAQDTCTLIYDATQAVWLVTGSSNNGA